MIAYKKYFTLTVILGLIPLLANSARGEDSDTRQIRDRVALLVQNAVTINTFDEMVLSLSKYNRDKIAEHPFSAYDRLNVSIARLHRSYSNAYGRTLVIPPEALGDIRIMAQPDKNKLVVKLTSNRIETIVRVNREAFIGNPWRIELISPTAELLADAIAMQCNTLAGTQWPRDPDAGRRIVAQQILAALLQPPPSAMVLQQTDAK